MAFPSVVSITETSFSSSTSSHNVDMPATVNSGDLLVMFFATGDIDDSYQTATPSGWTKLAEDRQSADAFGHYPGPFTVFYKSADGTEGGSSVNVVTQDIFSGSYADPAAAHVYRITGWNSIEAGTWAEDSSSSPDPPSLSPSWGAADTLWIAFAGYVDDDVAVSSYPTNYTNGVDTISGGGGNNGGTAATARRERNASSEDPGAFTLASSEVWMAITVAIEPSAAAPASTRRYSLSLTGVG